MFKTTLTRLILLSLAAVLLLGACAPAATASSDRHIGPHP